MIRQLEEVHQEQIDINNETSMMMVVDCYNGSVFLSVKENIQTYPFPENLHLHIYILRNGLFQHPTFSTTVVRQCNNSKVKVFDQKPIITQGSKGLAVTVLCAELVMSEQH